MALYIAAESLGHGPDQAVDKLPGSAIPGNALGKAKGFSPVLWQDASLVDALEFPKERQGESEFFCALGPGQHLAFDRG